MNSQRTCANCGTRLGAVEPAYAYGSHLVCGPCAARLQQQPQQQPHVAEDPQEAEDVTVAEPADAVAASLAAAAASRRRAAPARRARKSSGAMVLAIVAAVTLGCSGVAYYVLKGAMDRNAQRAAQSDAIDRYNDMLVAVNQLSQAGETPEAIAKVREAASLWDSTPAIQSRVSREPLDKLLDSLERRRAGGAGGSQSTPARPQPDFMSRGTSTPPPLPVADEPVFIAGAGDPSSPTETPAAMPADPQALTPQPADPAPSEVALGGHAPTLPADIAAAFESLRDGDVAAARKQFTVVGQVRKDDDWAAVGLAVCALHSNDRAGGVASLERLAARRNPSRIASAALAEVMLEDNPVRSAVVMKRYLESADRNDEPMLNLLGRCLSVCSSQGKTSTAVAEAERSYLVLSNRLHATRPGQSRWGAAWMSTADADRKWAALRDANRELAASREALRDAEGRLARLRQQQSDARTTIRREDMRGFARGIEEAEAQVSAARKRARAAETRSEQVERPDFGPPINLLALDALR